MWCCAAKIPDEVLLTKDGKAIDIDERDGPPKVTSLQWALVITMVSYMFLDGLQMVQTISWLPDYFTANHLGQTFVGICTSAQYGMIVVGNFFAPWASDKYGNLVRRLTTAPRAQN